MKKNDLKNELQLLLTAQLDSERAAELLQLSDMLGGEELAYLAQKSTWLPYVHLYQTAAPISLEKAIDFVLGERQNLFYEFELSSDDIKERRNLILLKENLSKLRDLVMEKKELEEEEPRWVATITFSGKGRQSTEFLIPGTTLIGALPPCHFRLDDPEVSGVHARFIFSERTGTCWVEDLRSTNGTFLLQESRKIRLSTPTEVEGRDYLLTYPQELRDGDRLLFGDTYASISIQQIK